MNEMATPHAEPGDKRLVDVASAAAAVNGSSAVIVDVRAFDEFAAGHAVGAVCIPLPDLERRCGEIPSDRPVLVMCQAGSRSAMAAERLRAIGFDNIVDIDGGFKAWSQAGLPSAHQSGVIPLERQVRGVAGALVFGFTVAGILASHWFLAVPVFVGFMLTLSAVTGLCPMMSILKLMPWNQVRNAASGARGTHTG